MIKEENNEEQSLFKIVSEIQDMKIDVLPQNEQSPDYDPDLVKTTVTRQYEKHEVITDGGENRVEEITQIIHTMNTCIDSEKLDEIQHKIEEQSQPEELTQQSNTESSAQNEEGKFK